MGATTLLRYGLVPALREEGFIAVYFRDWQGPNFSKELETLVAESVREQADPRFLSQPESLSDLLERVYWRTGRRVALVLDQFEDYLRCHVRLSDNFEAELSRAASSHDCRVIVAMQEYILTDFRRFEQYIPNLMGCHVQLGPLGEEGARQMIAETAAADGVRVDEHVTEALLRTPIVSEAGGFHPFYLATGLKRLLAQGTDRKWTTATMAVLEIYGGPERLILESLDLKLGQLNSTHTDLFFRWCGLLMSPAKDDRLAVTPKALTEFSGRLNRFAMTLLPRLIDLGILRTIDLPGGQRYEIARDCLVPIIHDWWKRRESEIIARRRAQFRIRSISIAAGAIVAVYLFWLFWSRPH